MSQSGGDPVMYGLYAVLVHSGYSCHAGHYYCYVKVRVACCWAQRARSRPACSGVRGALKSSEAGALFCCLTGNSSALNLCFGSPFHKRIERCLLHHGSEASKLNAHYWASLPKIQSRDPQGGRAELSPSSFLHCGTYTSPTPNQQTNK